jgi:hypothetical protein
MATVKLETRLQPEDVPDWVVRIIESLANRENITLEQATRMCIFRGALTYEAEWSEDVQQ